MILFDNDIRSIDTFFSKNHSESLVSTHNWSVLTIIVKI